MEELFGFVARSVIRHAVAGVLTGGIGNVGVIINDFTDLIELADHIDTITTVDTCDSSGSGDVLFGANGTGGRYPQGTDTWERPVAYEADGTPYSPNDPSATYSPNEIKPPSTTSKPDATATK
ncbi:uncharacterized protein FTOL_08213 [Fusarium torulosum]|uniref:Uncharacterized protein n=1 Tax=Fusarium torulosum TaxID=33205 RepID=A0AAE8SKH6_9HYPO|nr:uncharacterized protein FTOL_08213 [Fusarium torulosum]